MGKQHPQEHPIEDLKGQLLQDMEVANVRFRPECYEEYTTNVFHRMLVGDCDNITAQEKQDFVDAISSKANDSARTICALNPDCPKHRLLRYRWDRLSCRNRLLVADVKFWFVCEE